MTKKSTAITSRTPKTKRPYVIIQPNGRIYFCKSTLDQLSIPNYSFIGFTILEDCIKMEVSDVPLMKIFGRILNIRNTGDATICMSKFRAKIEAEKGIPATDDYTLFIVESDVQGTYLLKEKL